MTGPGHPVTVQALRDEPLSRWLWLVKWILVIPHYIVLFFLWVAFFLVTLVAFVAVLFTGRYPRSLFDFNLGVIRWSWRVGYYGYNALGTDRYPPFTLAERPDYPATVDIAYPERLSRGLVLVKWWLLAVPHYLILSVLVGGGTAAVYSADDEQWRGSGAGLLGLCVFFAGIALLFTSRYPGGLFDLVTGVNRWALRVLAYAALMTDRYPPFRLDQGGAEPSAPVGPRPVDTTSRAAAPVASGSRAGPLIALLLGFLLLLGGLALAAPGGAALWATAQRDSAGYLTTPDRDLSSSTAAITVEDVDLRFDRGPASWDFDDFGRIRIRATADDERALFVGIAPQSDVDNWLRGVAHDQLQRAFGDRSVRYLRRDGDATMEPPTDQTFWAASVSGTGTQELTWNPESGRWAVVIARADGAPGVRANADVGAKIPSLTGAGVVLLLAALALLAIGVALIVLGAAGLGRHTGGPAAATDRTPPPTPQPVDSGTAARN
jgi:hypothetical protein